MEIVDTRLNSFHLSTITATSILWLIQRRKRRGNIGIDLVPSLDSTMENFVAGGWHRSNTRLIDGSNYRKMASKRDPSNRVTLKEATNIYT